MLRRSVLPSAVQEEPAREIIAFRRDRKDRQTPATVLLAKTYLDQAEQNVDEASNLRRRQALRWFFRMARECRTAGPDPRARVLTPPPAAASHCPHAQPCSSLDMAVHEFSDRDFL
jgi:hypothetical protein